MLISIITFEMTLVFMLILIVLIIFITEYISPDITAIGVLVSLAILEPYTGVSSARAIEGFASPATVTIIAMYILSKGIEKTGIVNRLALYLARITKGDEDRLLVATIGTTGASAGIINNTPIVAIFIPMITGLAEKSHISPSKLLLPLSYAAMLGGTLTLIGTATNILASDLSSQLLNHPISMFEFTPLGILIFIIGSIYLIVVGRKIIPERIKPTKDLTKEYEVTDHIYKVRVKDDSKCINKKIDELSNEIKQNQRIKADILQLERGDELYIASSSDQKIQKNDLITIKSTRKNINRLYKKYNLEKLPRWEVSEGDLTENKGNLIEAVALPNSRFIGSKINETDLKELYNTTLLAIKRGQEIIKINTGEIEIKPGDTLLLQTTPETIKYLSSSGELIVTEGIKEELSDETIDAKEIAPISPKAPIAFLIMAGVILTAALGVTPIVISALGGVFLMFISGCISTSEAYSSINWNIIFLLAGILPLGIAMQNTGGDQFIANILVSSSEILPLIGVLFLFYIITGVLSSIITPVASVVLMIPIAVDTATQIGANGFSFLLAVMFASASAFMTPIGYQTNLMVYGPGKYRFTDYLKVGGPLHLLLAFTTTIGIKIFFGI